jgi:hypothetical protein
MLTPQHSVLCPALVQSRTTVSTVVCIDSCNTPYHSDCESTKSTTTTATAATTAASSLSSYDDDYSVGFTNTSDTTSNSCAWGTDELVADELIKDIYRRQVSDFPLTVGHHIILLLCIYDCQHRC